ncbi:hypothetical protein IIC65_02670 [Candidatus Sumerlaeota bacterium]|nr:hypothetical protein [Candidatus Sumerlaeota bacterium]
MSQYDNTNTGALFSNKEKKDGDKQPDYKGPLNVNGVDLEVAAWLKTSKAGQKYMSLSVQPKWEAPDQRPSGTQSRADHAASQDDDYDDSAIPF